MRFPMEISIVLAKIALERVMSPERADELVAASQKAVDEIKAWWNRREQEAAEGVTAQDAIQAAAQEMSEPVHDDQLKEATGVVRRIQEQIDEQASEKDISEVIESEIRGKRKTWVVWLDDAKVMGANGGRYVHFSYSWDVNRKRYGYRIRDFKTNTILYPPETSESSSEWTHRVLNWTADDVWRATKRRIKTATETGLGKTDLGSVDDNRDCWKAVLNALTMNMPVKTANSRGAVT